MAATAAASWMQAGMRSQELPCGLVSAQQLPSVRWLPDAHVSAHSIRNQQHTP